MELIKSSYQLKMEQRFKEGKVKFLTTEQNEKIARQFTNGLDEYRREQVKLKGAAQKALAKIRLNW